MVPMRILEEIALFLAHRAIIIEREKKWKFNRASSKSEFMHNMQTYGPRDAFFCQEALTYITSVQKIKLEQVSYKDVRNLADVFEKKINEKLVKENLYL